MAASFAFAILVMSGARLCAESPIERGAYLVNAVAACRSCHTPRDPSAAPLSGGTRYGSGPAAEFAANITPDVETGIGNWSKQQIIDAVRLGVRPDGSHIGPPMPQGAYRFMSDDDAAAVADYLKSVPPVRHAVPRATPDAASPETVRPALTAKQNSPADAPVSRGSYIVTAVAHCTECHDRSTSSPSQDTAPSNRVFRGPWGVVTAPSIAPEALTAHTDAELTTLITTGKRADGSALIGPMPVGAYAGLRPDDLAAIVAYLRDQSPQSAPMSTPASGRTARPAPIDTLRPSADQAR